jgi:hypothetical protein
MWILNHKVKMRKTFAWDSGAEHSKWVTNATFSWERHTPVSPAFWRPRQKDPEFEGSLNYPVSKRKKSHSFMD